MAQNSNTFSQELGFSSYRFFSKQMHPRISKAGQKRIFSASRYERHEDLEYILVRSGKGMIIVNNVAYEVKGGSATMFMSYCFHKFLPAPGEVLVIDYFQISAGTYLYMQANPYVTSISYDIPQPDVAFTCFQGSEFMQVKQLFDRMRSWDTSDNLPQKYVFYALEYVGRLNRRVREDEACGR